MISIFSASFSPRRSTFFAELFETADAEMRTARVRTLPIWLKKNVEKAIKERTQRTCLGYREWCETLFDTIFCEPLH